MISKTLDVCPLADNNSYVCQVTTVTRIAMVMTFEIRGCSVVRYFFIKEEQKEEFNFYAFAAGNLSAK